VWHTYLLEEGNTCKILVAKPKEKKLLGKSWHRWENNIKEAINEICMRL